MSGMMDLLSPEERMALQDPFGSAPVSTPAKPAAFRSVGHLDPGQINLLKKSIQAILEPLCRELSRQLRVACNPENPVAQILSPKLLPPAEDEALWLEVRGCTGHYILFGMPRVFAAAITERVFGAPLNLRDDRDLAPGEKGLLKDFLRGWIPHFTRVWREHEFRICSGPDKETQRDAPSADWLMFTIPLECGPVQGAFSMALAPATARLLLGEAPNTGAGTLSQELVDERLGDVPVELSAVLGRADFTMDELASLRLGDVIALNRRQNDPVEIFLEDQPFYRARAGLAGQVVALELLAPLTEKSDR
jgi:flagellar motor switch/type III secretory pathway protein FliN